MPTSTEQPVMTSEETPRPNCEAQGGCQQCLVSHPSLVAVAAKWLQKKHAVVITELATTGEEPDAIGWRGTHSTLVECKISRADFNADKSKWFRREAWQGIGTHRYFLTVPGIIRVEELPEKWGLLELTGGRVRMVRESEHFGEVNHRHEIGILLSTLRRIGHNAPKGTSIKHYTIETKNRATLGTARMANADFRHGSEPLPARTGSGAFSTTYKESEKR